MQVLLDQEYLDKPKSLAKLLRKNNLMDDKTTGVIIKEQSSQKNSEREELLQL
ncbi:MAG: hypothetical protein H6622_11010 [Halobacteriovoraceae bacterium]|nr:hypothetical protein [Halobacteriovoraceae bacterium]